MVDPNLLNLSTALELPSFSQDEESDGLNKNNGKNRTIDHSKQMSRRPTYNQSEQIDELHRLSSSSSLSQPRMPPPSTQALSRTMSAISVLYMRGSKPNSSPIADSDNNPRSLHQMPSLDNLISPSESSVYNRNRSHAEFQLQNSSPINNAGEEEGNSVVVTYKQDNSEGLGRSSSRYYERMVSRPWLPSLNVTRRSSIHVPQLSTSSVSVSPVSIQTPLLSPPLTPETPLPRNLSNSGIKPTSPSDSASGNSYAITNQVITSNESTASTVVTTTATISADSVISTKLQSSSQSTQDANGLSSSHIAQDNHDHSFMENAVPPLALYAYNSKIFGTEPPQLGGHCSTLVNDKLYIFGGRTNDGFSQQLYLFNCATNTLTNPTLTGTIPKFTYRMSAVLVEKYIYYIGGQNDEKCTNAIYTLNTMTFRFSKVQRKQGSRLLEPRRGHTSVLHQSSSTIYVIGGFKTDSTPLNDVWKLNVTKSPDNCTLSEVISLDKDTERWPSPRGNHSAHITNINKQFPQQKLIIFGGNDSYNVFGDTWSFDFMLEKWTLLPEPQFAENDYSRYLRHVESYASLSNVHTPKSATKLHPARTLHTSFLTGNFLTVVGGHDGQGIAHNILHVLDLSHNVWRVRGYFGVQSLPCEHTGSMYDSRYFIYGGCDKNQAIAGVKVIEMPMFPFADLSS